MTLASYRGLGIYPRLLQAILRFESEHAERFWIAYAPENRASGSGIAKAGLYSLAEMSFDEQGRPALRSIARGGARWQEATATATGTRAMRRSRELV